MQTGFEILVPFFVRIPQGVEYDSLSIPRIDQKYNPVAHDVHATQLKQYGYQIEGMGYRARKRSGLPEETIGYLFQVVF